MKELTIANDYSLLLGPYESGFFIRKDISEEARAKEIRCMLASIEKYPEYFYKKERAFHTEAFVKKWKTE